MRVLVLSTLFPSRTRPAFGVFVKERLRHVAARCDVVVVAPVPWFPGNRWIRGRALSSTPFIERQEGLTVYHPRIFSIPGVGKALDAVLYALSVLPLLVWLRRRFPFDLIDAQFGYPDGVAAALLGKLFRRRVMITLRGDEMRVSAFALRRVQLAAALRAARVIAVSEALRQFARRFGVDVDAVRVIPNGVDPLGFHPSDRRVARARLGIAADRLVLLAVGGIVERKGHHHVIEVLPRLVADRPDVLYVVVGGAPRGSRYPAMIDELVTRHGLQPHVRLVGARPHEEIAHWVAAADLFCLATGQEGCCNAIREALACGLPVVSTRVGGNPDLVREGQDGFLVPYWDAEAFVAAIRRAVTHGWDRAAIAAYAQRHTWEDTASMVIREMEETLRR
jgi:glycosyltransferase involved in cell wall biosynthesis